MEFILIKINYFNKYIIYKNGFKINIKEQNSVFLILYIKYNNYNIYNYFINKV